MAQMQPAGTLLGHPQRTWREKTRLELGLATDRPIIATGHQTMLWHPGILAKYIVMDAAAEAYGLGRANLIVDQHVDDFGSFEAPVRRGDGSLGVRRVELTAPRQDVPMGLQPAFVAPREPAGVTFASEDVAAGVRRIIKAINAHADAPNAAIQMAMVLGDLIARWVKPVTNITATDLVQTSLGKAMLTAMADDPHRCAEAYNAAVTEVSEAGIGPLLVRDDYVELPVWRIRPDGRRMRGYDSDAQAALADAGHPPLLPRALFMTALVRLGMCDVFIHGTGGANYDRAMERWIEKWLGVEVGRVAVATATLRLPLGVPNVDTPSESTPGDDLIERARQAARRAWHDPRSFNSDSDAAPSASKRQLLAHVDAAPRRSPQRKAAFFAMHHELERLRGEHAATIEQTKQHLRQAQRAAADAAVAQRRDWPFALYPQAMIDALAEAIRDQAVATSPSVTATGRAGS